MVSGAAKHAGAGEDGSGSGSGGDGAGLLASGVVDSAAAASPVPAYPRMFSKEDKGRYALITLTLINLLNYIDRYVPSATKQYIQDDLHLSDTETSVPLTAFVFVYMVTSTCMRTSNINPR